MSTPAARIAVIGASLTISDPMREPGYPWYVERLIQQRGMYDSIVRGFCRDGLDIWRARHYGLDAGQPAPYGNIGTIGAKIFAFRPTDIWISGDVAINAEVFNVDGQSEADIETDTRQFIADLGTYFPGIPLTYVRMIPPAVFTYGGVTYVTATSNNGGWAAYDALLQSLMSRKLTIDYDLVFRFMVAMGLAQALDGIHECKGVSSLFSAMVYDGMPALYLDLQSANYGPFEDCAAALNAAMNTVDPNHALALATLRNLGFAV